MINNIFELNDYYVSVRQGYGLTYGNIITKEQYDQLVLTDKEYYFVALSRYYIEQMLRDCKNIKKINDRNGVGSDKSIPFLNDYYVPSGAAYLNNVKIGDILFDAQQKKIGQVITLPDNNESHYQSVGFMAGANKWWSNYNDHTNLLPYFWPLLKVTVVKVKKL